MEKGSVMSVWLTIPSARPNGGTIPAWRAAGYKIAVVRDEGEKLPYDVDIFASFLPYPGYSIAVNELVRMVIKEDPSAEFFIIGGDDTLPDFDHAPDQIAAEIKAHFGDTFAVCQPTGDRLSGGSIDRIAGSAWMGRSFCERMYGGNGPLYHGYEHMHVDEELFCVATMLGVYWARPDLIHFHQHFMRKDDSINSPAVQRPVPPHLVRWNSPRHWQESQHLFRSRKAAGFPGHEPLSSVSPRR